MRVMARRFARFGHCSFRDGSRRLMPAHRMIAANLKLKMAFVASNGEGYRESLPGIARRKTRVNALMPRQSIQFRKKMDARVKPAHDLA
jgi:hypothetical protein